MPPVSAGRPPGGGASDVSTVETHAKRHPARLQGALGFGGFAMEGAACPRLRSMDVLGSQGWVSCGRFLVDWPPL